MRSTIPRLRSLLLALAFASPFALAGGGPVSKMADILVDLNHYPSAEEKEALQAIAEDEANSDAVQTVANALRNMEHKVGGDDATKLEAVTNDDAVSEDVRKLAGVLLNINHKPGPEQMETLKSLKKHE